MLRVAVGLIVCDIVALGEDDTLRLPLELEVIDAERLSVGDNVSLRVADALMVCEIVALVE